MKRNLRELTMRNRTAPLSKVFLILCLIMTAPATLGFGVDAPRDSGDGDRDGGNSSFQNSSNRVRACEQFVGLRWAELGLGDEGGSYLNKAEIKDLLAKTDGPFIQGLASAKGCQQAANGGQSLGPECVARQLDHLIFCEAYALSLETSNYTENAEKFSERSSEPSFGAAALPCLNQPTGAAQQQCMMQAQMQEPLKCKNKGPETHDFLHCKKILNFIDGFAIGKVVMQEQQKFRAGAKQLELQDDYLKKVRKNEAGIVDGMEVQRETLEQQGNLAYEMAAFDAGKAATLLMLINSAPRPGNFIDEECSQQVNSSDVSASLQEITASIVNTYGGNDKGAFIDSINGALQNFQISKGGENEGVSVSGVAVADQGSNGTSICERAIGTANGSNNIFLSSNQKVFDRLKQEAIKAGLDALANGAKGALLHDQAGMIDDAMNDIEEFAPPEFPVAEAVEATASECLVNPEAEGCIGPNAGGFDGFRDQGFSASFDGVGANLGQENSRGTIDDDDSTNGAGGPNRSLIPNDFGVVQQAGESDNSFSDGTARAGSIKAGQLAAGGAAGGGGGGAGGGGLGGAPGRGPASKKSPSGKKDIKIKTKGDGLSAVGGRGRIGSRKKKKAANPFSKLLGKNKKGGNKTLNFRGPAQLGSKKGSLFQMISNRYSDVSSKNRLLKYEAAKDAGQ